MGIMCRFIPYNLTVRNTEIIRLRRYSRRILTRTNSSVQCKTETIICVIESCGFSVRRWFVILYAYRAHNYGRRLMSDATR